MDKNFINYPFNLLENNSKCLFWSMENQWGRYEMSCHDGIPDHHDMLVFYAALIMLMRQRQSINKIDWEDSEKKYRIYTTRYAIAKLVYKDVSSLSAAQYNNINESLKKWVTFSIDFKGVFYKTKDHGWASFGLINSVIYNHDNNALMIDFNSKYIDQIEESDFYSMVDFDELKKITAPSAGRLYQLLSINFDTRNKWQIELQKLAEKLTLKKRPKAKRYYAADVEKKIKAGIDEINKKTSLRFIYSYDKPSNVFTFKKVAMAIPAIRATKIMPNPKKELLATYGIRNGSEEIDEKYSIEYLQSKILLLHSQTCKIKHPSAWLKKAILEDWVMQNGEVVSLNKLKKQRIKESEEARLKHEKEKLEERFSKHLDNLAMKRFDKLDPIFKRKIEQDFDVYFKELSKSNQFARIDIYWLPFLKEQVLTDEDKNYEQWLSKRKTSK